MRKLRKFLNQKTNKVELHQAGGNGLLKVMKKPRGYARRLASDQRVEKRRRREEEERKRQAAERNEEIKEMRRREKESKKESKDKESAA